MILYNTSYKNDVSSQLAPKNKFLLFRHSNISLRKSFLQFKFILKDLFHFPPVTHLHTDLELFN